MVTGKPGAIHTEKEIGSKPSILILQSVFLGIFAGAFDIGAQTLFIDTFGSSMIPLAFVWSGAAGIFITSVYSFLQTRMKFSFFSLINFFFIILCTLGLRIGFELTGDSRLVFAMFVLMGPLTIIALLGFWGTAGRSFSFRQGKRIFGIIDIGAISGMILSFYALPFLLNLGMGIPDILYLCASSMVIVFGIQTILVRGIINRSEEEVILNHDVNRRKPLHFFRLFGNYYTRLILLFVGLSVCASFFIHYSFLSVLDENYTNPIGLASFLGFFMGTVMITSLLFKILLYKKLMKTFGMRVALLISPAILVLIVILSIFVGQNYGFNIGSAGFILFFLLISSAKLFSKSLKDSIEVPSSKILYQSLDANLRLEAQARIDGVINEMAALSAGLIIAGLSFWHFNLLQFQYSLGFVLVLWLISGIALYRAYRRSLQLKLRNYIESSEGIQGKKSIKDARLAYFTPDGKLSRILEYFPQSWNGFITRNMEKLINSEEKKVSNITLQWITDLNISESLGLLASHSQDAEEPQRSRMRKLIDRFRSFEPKSGNIEEMAQWIRSPDPEDRLRAVTAILTDFDRVDQSVFLPLLRDLDYRVQASTVRAIGLLRASEMGNFIIDLLDHPNLYPHAYSALSRMGEVIFEKLELAGSNSKIPLKKLIRLIRLISDSGHPSAGKLLLKFVDHQNLMVKREALEGLLRITFKVDDIAQSVLFRLIYEICGINAWNMAAIYSATLHKLPPGLSRTLDEEIELNMDLVFSALSLIYDKQLMVHIRKNIRHGITEGDGFAIDLLDLFIDEDLKKWLFPLLEDQLLPSKLHGLQAEFPVKVHSPVGLINAILNRDYNQISPMVKLFALKSIEAIDGYIPGNDLLAQVFNTDASLAAIAAEQTILKDFKTYEMAGNRLPAGINNQILGHMAAVQAGKPDGQWDKIRILKESGIFSDLNHQQLYTLSARFIFMFTGRGEKISVADPSISNCIIYVFEGELNVFALTNGHRLPSGSFFRVKDFSVAFGDNAKFISETESGLLLLDEDVLKEFIFDYEFEFGNIPEKLLET